MKFQDFRFSNPQYAKNQLIQIIQQDDNLDINLLLGFIEAVKGRIQDTLTGRISEAIEWAEVADFALEQAIEKYPAQRDTLLYQRMKLQLTLIKKLRANLKSDVIKFPLIAIWLGEELAKYDITETQKLIQIWKDTPDKIPNQQLLSLRRLRQWIIILGELNQIEDTAVPKSLQSWIELKGLLP